MVALTDTNCDPDVVDYVIPGNDDAIRSIYLISRLIADSILEGRGEDIVLPEERPLPPAVEETLVDEEEATEPLSEAASEGGSAMTTTGSPDPWSLRRDRTGGGSDTTTAGLKQARAGIERPTTPTPPRRHNPPTTGCPRSGSGFERRRRGCARRRKLAARRRGRTERRYRRGRSGRQCVCGTGGCGAGVPGDRDGRATALERGSGTRRGRRE